MPLITDLDMTSKQIQKPVKKNYSNYQDMLFYK